VIATMERNGYLTENQGIDLADDPLFPRLSAQ
jgi:hypothetical protein